MSFLEKSHSNSLTPTLPLVGQSLVTRSRPSASAWVITLTLTPTLTLTSLALWSAFSRAFSGVAL